MSAIVNLLAVAAASGSVQPPTTGLVSSLFRSEASGLTKQGYVCVQINGVDPSIAQLSEIARSESHVVMGSACTKVIDVDKGSFHTKTRTPAYFFNVYDFVSNSVEHAEVKVSIYHHGLWAIYETLEVEKRGDAWVIARVKEHTES